MTTRTRRPRKPLTCRMVDRPVAPCELLPAGVAGVVMIGEALYALAVHAERHPTGPTAVHGYRLTKDDGTTYDLPADAGSCECLGFLRWGHCKHQETLRALILR